jgi:hypothetical protein
MVLDRAASCVADTGGSAWLRTCDSAANDAPETDPDRNTQVALVELALWYSLQEEATHPTAAAELLSSPSRVSPIAIDASAGLRRLPAVHERPS